MDKTAPDYEPPMLTVLGAVADVTELDASGPNPDLAGFSPSIPSP